MEARRVEVVAGRGKGYWGEFMPDSMAHKLMHIDMKSILKETD